MARKPSGKPWLHGASGWWCATIGGKRKRLHKDYRAACRKLKALQTASKRGGLGERDWLDAPFSVLADEYLANVQAGKKPATYRSLRYRLLRAIRILGVSLLVGELRKFHLAKIDQELQSSGYSPTAVRDTIATVQGVFNWAVGTLQTRGLLRPDPGVSHIRNLGHKGQVITAEARGVPLLLSVFVEPSDAHVEPHVAAFALVGPNGRPDPPQADFVDRFQSLSHEWAPLLCGFHTFSSDSLVTNPRCFPATQSLAMRSAST